MSTTIGTPFTDGARRVLLCGSGELGKEVVIELQRYGVEVIAVDAYANAPAMQVADRAQEEGADVIISSTHKTLAGPQGGMVLTNDKSIAERIGPAIAPLLVSNHHLGRLPALAATFLEWAEYGLSLIHI